MTDSTVSSAGSIIANYTVVFKPNQVLGRQDEITDFTKTVFNDKLSVTNITLGSEIITVNNSQMLKQLADESKLTVTVTTQLQGVYQLNDVGY